MTGRSGDDTAAAASGEKYWAMPGGITGRAPPDAVAAADAGGGAGCALEAACVGPADEAARLVAVCLQTSKPPRANVRQSFVIEVDWILSSEYDADASGTSLLQQ